MEGLANTLGSYRKESPSQEQIADLFGVSQRIRGLLRQFEHEAKTGRGQSILGVPLLAVLAVWLVLNDRHPPRDMLEERATLYRRLADLTCRRGGKVFSEAAAEAYIKGPELRELLRHTAAAMTLRGKEQVSYEEWTGRLKGSGFIEKTDLAIRSVGDSLFARFMLSFFLTPKVREHGCEFLHKSFREYFFAEAIVEALKALSSKGAHLSRRGPYWQEFPHSDPRREEIKRLARLLGPQWLTPDVVQFIDRLISWEIERSASGDKEWADRDETAPIGLTEWQIVRDRLAAFWDWWPEGVHLRPQPEREEETEQLKFQKPLAVWLIELLRPLDLPKDQLPEPRRVVTIDGHLGDALFRLNCSVHFELNRATGWLDRASTAVADIPMALWEGAQKSGEAGRPYQVKITQGEHEWWAFAPGTPDGTSNYLSQYMSRIQLCWLAPRRGVSGQCSNEWGGFE